jgi:hypothetical protein
MTDKMIEQAQRAMSFEFKGMGRVISYSEQQEDDDDEDDSNNDDGRQLGNGHHDHTDDQMHTI